MPRRICRHRARLLHAPRRRLAGHLRVLNCGLGSKDEAAAVRENRARVAAHLRRREPAHGAPDPQPDRRRRRRTAWPDAERPRADALVTATRGIAVGVLAADCTPVLFADPEAGVVGRGPCRLARGHRRGAGSDHREHGRPGRPPRATSGRRSARASARMPMRSAGTSSRSSWSAMPTAGRFSPRPRPDARPHFDLPGYALHRLRRAGLARALQLYILHIYSHR